jgi:hypothetical protein
MERLLLVIPIMLMISCSPRNINKGQVPYDIQVEYLSTPTDDKRELMNDTLIIVFDGNFDGDTVDVLVNNRLFKELILTTDDVVGTAGIITTTNYKKVKSIGIRINKGKLIYIEPEKTHYNIRITYLNDKVHVRFYRSLPGYM